MDAVKAALDGGTVLRLGFDDVGSDEADAAAGEQRKEAEGEDEEAERQEEATHRELSRGKDV
jgi:hypothetical protein